MRQCSYLLLHPSTRSSSFKDFFTVLKSNQYPTFSLSQSFANAHDFICYCRQIANWLNCRLTQSGKKHYNNNYSSSTFTATTNTACAAVRARKSKEIGSKREHLASTDIAKTFEAAFTACLPPSDFDTCECHIANDNNSSRGLLKNSSTGDAIQVWQSVRETLCLRQLIMPVPVCVCKKPIQSQ